MKSFITPSIITVRFAIGIVNISVVSLGLLVAATQGVEVSIEIVVVPVFWFFGIIGEDHCLVPVEEEHCVAQRRDERGKQGRQVSNGREGARCGKRSRSRRLPNLCGRSAAVSIQVRSGGVRLAHAIRANQR